MRLTWSERRAINRAVNAEIAAKVAEVGVRIAEAELEQAKTDSALAEYALTLHKMDRWAEGAK